MKKLVLITALTCGINGLTCFAYPVLTEQDRRSIASTNLTEGQKQLAEHLVGYAREEGQRFGVDPALAFAQSPTGIDDREYRRDRLRELREKRETQKLQIERLQSRKSLKESLPRDEAVLLVAKQIGVSPDKTQMLLAKYESSPADTAFVSEEDSGQTMDADKLFSDKALPMTPKEAQRARKAQEAAEKKAAEQANREALRQKKEAMAEERQRAQEAKKQQAEEKRAQEKQNREQAKAEKQLQKEAKLQEELKEENLPYYTTTDKKASVDSKTAETTPDKEKVAPEDVSMAAIRNPQKQVPALFPEDYVYTPEILSEEGK